MIGGHQGPLVAANSGHQGLNYFQEETNAAGESTLLRHSRFVALREDMEAGDVQRKAWHRICPLPKRGLIRGHSTNCQLAVLPEGSLLRYSREAQDRSGRKAYLCQFIFIAPGSTESGTSPCQGTNQHDESYLIKGNVALQYS